MIQQFVNSPSHISDSKNIYFIFELNNMHVVYVCRIKDAANVDKRRLLSFTYGAAPLQYIWI